MFSFKAAYFCSIVPSHIFSKSCVTFSSVGFLGLKALKLYRYCRSFIMYLARGFRSSLGTPTSFRLIGMSISPINLSVASIDLKEATRLVTLAVSSPMTAATIVSLQTNSAKLYSMAYGKAIPQATPCGILYFDPTASDIQWPMVAGPFIHGKPITQPPSVAARELFHL